MDVDAFVADGWANHGKDPKPVADRLPDAIPHVTDGDQAAKLMQLTGHVLGDHLGRRDEAVRLCEAAFRAAGDTVGPPARVQLAVARTLAGDEEGARAALAEVGDDPAQCIRVGLLVAQGHANTGRWEDAERIYFEHAAAAAALPAGHAAERTCAIVGNNIASEILNQAPRSPRTDRLLLRAAEDARTNWCRIGTWVNDERADYLLAMVHNRLEAPKAALLHADRGLATIAEADGEQPVDEAFLHLARATAMRDLGLADEQAASLARAESLARDFDGDGLLAWFHEELAKAR